MGKLLAKINLFNLTDKDFCLFGNANTGKLCNLKCALTNDFCIEGAVDNNSLTNVFCFLRAKEIASTTGKLSLNLIINCVKHDY